MLQHRILFETRTVHCGSAAFLPKAKKRAYNAPFFEEEILSHFVQLNII